MLHINIFYVCKYSRICEYTYNWLFCFVLFVFVFVFYLFVVYCFCFLFYFPKNINTKDFKSTIFGWPLNQISWYNLRQLQLYCMTAVWQLRHHCHVTEKTKVKPQKSWSSQPEVLISLSLAIELDSPILCCWYMVGHHSSFSLFYISSLERWREMKCLAQGHNTFPDESIRTRDPKLPHDREPKSSITRPRSSKEVCIVTKKTCL